VEKALVGSWLTTSDVARRLGVTPGTVRHYGEILRSRGYEMPQREENGVTEWLWAPELAELARAAYQLARSVQPRLSFEDALELIEYAGRLAVQAQEGDTLPEVVARLLRRLNALPEAVSRLEAAASALSSSAAQVERAGEEAAGRVRAVVQATENALRDVVASVRRAVPGGGWVVGALLLLALAQLASLRVEALSALLPYMGASLLGALVGYFFGSMR